MMPQAKVQFDRDRKNFIDPLTVPHIEIDRSDNGVYRVWSGFHLIGLFYECKTCWVAEPVEGKPRRCRNAEAATKVVVRTYHHANIAA